MLYRSHSKILGRRNKLGGVERLAYGVVLSAVVALSAASAWADDSAEEGLWQKKISGSWTTTADPSVGGTLVPGALIASCAGDSYTYNGTTYTMGDSQTWAYSGVMYMAGGVTYRFVKNYDDNGCIIITDPDTDVKTTVILSTSYNETKYGTYKPAEDGYYPIYLAVYNGTGGKGPVSAPFNNASQLGAGLAWTDDPSVTDCTTANYQKWHKFLNNPDEDPIFYTSEPPHTPLRILKIPTQHVQAGKYPEVGFTLTNRVTGAYWVFAEGGVSPNPTPFDVSYSFADGMGTVTATGKVGSEYEGEIVTRDYIVTDEFLLNGGFETGGLAPGWTGTVTVGNSSSAYGPNYSTTFISGTYCGIIQMSRYAQQVFTVDSSCRATLSWKCKHRNNWNAGTPMYYTVLLDGEVIYPEEKLTGGDVLYRTVESVLLTPGEHTLLIEGRTDNNADSTVFLDDVSLRIVSPLYILPIPDQFSQFGENIEPGFTVTNCVTGSCWTFGPGGTSTDDPPIDVSYSYGEGYGVVAVTGKPGGEAEGEFNSRSFTVYHQIKSITSTGSQYIDTGIVPGTNTAVEMHFNTTNCENNTVLFGAGAGNANYTYCFYQYDYYYFRGNSSILGMLYERGVDAFISINTNASNNCYLDIGGNTATKTVSLSYTGANKLDIFASNNGGMKSKLTLYSFRIWQDGELVRDFVPVRSVDKAGLWDFVSASFFRNLGTGAFLAGPDITDIVVDKIPNQFFTGDPLTPPVVVSNFAGTALLVKDVDYTVTYEDNAAVGAGRAIVTGVGSYSSVVTNEFAIYSVPAAPAFTVKSYVQHGLMNHWDALDNAGTGTFDPTARTWKDLKGNLDFALTDNAQWGGDFLETAGYAGVAKGKTGKYLTLEIKHRNCKARRGMPFFSGYAWNRVVWHGALSHLWFHHANGQTRKVLTGLTAPDTVARDYAVVYGAPGDNYGGDAPMIFYNGGTRITTGIAYQNVNNGNLNWATSFTRASIGAADSTRYNFEGRLYSIRLYSCPLSGKEIAYNAAVDKVRYDGVDPAEAFNSSDMRWNAASGKVEVLIEVESVYGDGTLSINGGGTNAWVSVGDEVYIEYKPASGEKALEWFDLPDGAPRTANNFIVDFTAEAPVSAKLQLLKEIDLSRALNADPGIEEGGSYFHDGTAWRTFMPVCWNRTSTSANLGTYSTTTEERGLNFLNPYQGAAFFQSGLALPAGSYTLTFDHSAVGTDYDHTIHSWRIYDATNGLVCTICNVTNETRVYGTAWRKVQADFTIAKDGIYKLQNVRTATGMTGNSYSYFDNVSITSASDLHIEVEKCYPYFGEGQAQPPVVVRDDQGNILTEGVDYDLVYGANSSVGSRMDYSNATTLQTHGNGYVAARGKGTHYGVAGANFRLGTPIYVKPDGLSTNGGTSWDDAVDFATALTLAASTNCNNEIWIAGPIVLSAAAATQTFFGNKIFRGGFKGTEMTIEEREEGAYSTIHGNGQFSAVVFRDCANVFFERLRFVGSPSRAISKTDWTGDVHIDNCIFEENGNAVFVQGRRDRSPYAKSSLYVRDSVFRNNISTNNANGAAAIYTYLTLRVSAENSLFDSNFAYNVPSATQFFKTSAIYANTSAISLMECDFVDNLAQGSTYGTVYSTGSDAKDTVQNCLFLGNRADGVNAASLGFNHPTLKKLSDVVNCTFYGNVNYTNNCCAGVKGVKGIVNIRNSIFYGNRVDFSDHADCSFDVDFTLLGNDSGVTYSFVNAASQLGTSMVYGDPLFVAPGDAHLLSEAGYFDSEGNLYYAEPGERSPAIDAGDPYCDFSRESSPNGTCINLGRYGNTEQASRTPVSGPDVDGIPQVWILWNDPDGYSMPTVSFMMGGNGSYATRGIVYVSTDGGETWEDVSGVVGGLVNGQPKEVLVPHYYIPGSTIMAKVELIGARQTSGPAVASVVVRGTLPPWYGKKGPNNVIHVNPDAIGNNDGTSWTDAFTSWADALNELSGVKNEIWIAGTNLLTEPMPSKVFSFPTVVRGGFTGVEFAADERPVGLRSMIDGQGKSETLNFSSTGSTIVERIHFARSTGSELKKTGMGDLTVRDCLFTDGSTSGMSGRGLYASGGTLRVSNCKFMNLIGPNEQNVDGGNGIFMSGCTAAYIDDCLFVTNGTAFKADGAWCRHQAAAVRVNSTPAIFRNCRFSACAAALREADVGGIVYFSGASGGSKMINCALVGNTDSRSMNIPASTTTAGAIAVYMSTTNATLDIENCTVAYNLSQAALASAGITVRMGTVNIKNSIIYGNVRGRKNNEAAGADIHVRQDGHLNISYTLVTGLTSNYVGVVEGGSINLGPGVITEVDPLLATTADDFLNLFKSATDYWYMDTVAARDTCAAMDVHPRTRTGYLLNGVLVKDLEKVESPTIDAGDQTSDYSNEPTVFGGAYNGGRVNLGFSGNTPEAALTKRSGTVYYIR